ADAGRRRHVGADVEAVLLRSGDEGSGALSASLTGPGYLVTPAWIVLRAPAARRRGRSAGASVDLLGATRRLAPSRPPRALGLAGVRHQGRRVGVGQRHFKHFGIS